MSLPRSLRSCCLVILFGCALLLSGCVYFRLLQLKNQLSDFDHNFAATTTDGVAIECLHPVLLGDDLRFLGIDPKSIKTNGANARWHVRWLKDEPPNTDEKTMHDVELFLDLRDDKLQSLHIPERYFEFFPKELFVDLLRSTGKASIDKLTRKAEVKAGQEFGQGLAILPAQKSIENLLGVPTERIQDSTTMRYRYRYRTETPAGRGKAIEMVFYFDGKTGDLRKLVGKLPKGTMSYDFSPADEPSGDHSAAPTDKSAPSGADKKATPTSDLTPASS